MVHKRNINVIKIEIWRERGLLWPGFLPRFCGFCCSPAFVNFLLLPVFFVSGGICSSLYGIYSSSDMTSDPVESVLACNLENMSTVFSDASLMDSESAKRFINIILECSRERSFTHSLYGRNQHLYLFAHEFQITKFINTTQKVTINTSNEWMKLLQQLNESIKADN